MQIQAEKTLRFSLGMPLQPWHFQRFTPAAPGTCFVQRFAQQILDLVSAQRQDEMIG